jgi:hypothetical protein
MGKKGALFGLTNINLPDHPGPSAVSPIRSGPTGPLFNALAQGGLEVI